MTTRERTRVVNAGGVLIGGGNPVTVQSMTNTDTRDIDATVGQIKRLAEAGCEIARVAVPDAEAAEAFRAIKKSSPVPLVADIHFDYRLALAAIKNGADKLRVNPGNIGGAERLKQVAAAARAAGIPLRAGVNGGSLEKRILHKYGGVTAEGLAESALEHVALLESFGFYDIVVSIKASDIPLMLRAHKLLTEQTDCPLHIGVTEAGTVRRGALRSAVGLGALLGAGVGDTVRVSLAGDPVEEVRCARDILQAMKLRRFGADVIVCPTCGRTKIDIQSLARQVEDYCGGLNVPLTVAVMGCAVNGPGEAREADLGIAGGDGEGVLFRKGKIIKKLKEEELAGALINEIKSFNI